jgi:hypothetical protein
MPLFLHFHEGLLMLLASFVHGPNDALDYYVDWNPWLAGDTIVDSAWVVTGVATIYDLAILGNLTQIWVKEATLDTLIDLTNHILTAEGREMEATLRLKVRN